MDDLDDMTRQHRADLRAIKRIAEIDAMPARQRGCCILEREDLVNELNSHGYDIPHRGSKRAPRKLPKRRRTVLPTHCKITRNLRHRLIQIHLHMGLEESMRACVEAGVNPHYAQIICRQDYGYSAPRRKKTKPLEPHVTRQCYGDKKWARAIAVGMVVA